MSALARRLSSLRIEALAFGAMLFVIAAALAIALIPTRDPAYAVTIPMTPARAALVEATTGVQANELRAIGDQAKLINAALPFANGPVHSASPFLVRGGDLDQRRALLCLTQAVYYEAGFEPLEGRRAVAQVVLNRLRHPAFPKSVCGVVYQGAGRVCQFTFVCDGALYRAPARDAWLVAEQVARAALAGYVETRVGEATHYHADYVAPRWAPMLAKVSQIGQHIFYRWPGAWGQPAAFNGRYIGEPRDPLALRPPPPANPSLATGEIAIASGPVTDGTVLSHAPDDVGGLLDTSKGWTLRIPGPDETGGATRAIASQQGKPAPAAPAPAAAAPAAVAAAAATQVASR
jgi:hypothetical protein